MEIHSLDVYMFHQVSTFFLVIYLYLFSGEIRTKSYFFFQLDNVLKELI